MPKKVTRKKAFEFKRVRSIYNNKLWLYMVGNDSYGEVITVSNRLAAKNIVEALNLAVRSSNS
jgi:hypothetical protein